MNHLKWIFHINETVRFLSLKGCLILDLKDKNVYNVGTFDKNNVTTLIAINTTGTIEVLLTIFKFKCLSKDFTLLTFL